MEEIIVVEKLNKSYQHKSTVHDLCFTVCQGEIVGLLGPNGAGKSTTINILSTILKPDSGNVSIGGYDLAKDKSKIKKFIGIVPQDLSFLLKRALPHSGTVQWFQHLQPQMES